MRRLAAYLRGSIGGAGRGKARPRQFRDAVMRKEELLIVVFGSEFRGRS